MNLRKLLAPFAVLAVAAFGAFVLLATAPAVESVEPEKTLPLVRIIEVKPGDRRMQVRSQGTVAPRTESELVPEVSGRVEWMSPSLVSGGFFTRDEPLLRIDPRDYAAALARARSEVARAEGESEHAADELERQLGLARSNANSPSQLSNAKRAERVASAALEAAKVSFEQAQRDLARTELVAPFDGRVRVEQVDVGQFVSRGAPIATLYSTDFAEIRLPLADRQLAYLDLPGIRGDVAGEGGPRVLLRANFAGKERTWVGQIVRTEGEIDAQSRMVHVVARVEDPYGIDSGEAPAQGDAAAPLAVGMFVRAEIEGHVLRDVVVVPRAAIRDGEALLVIDGDDRLRRLPIEILRIDREEVMLRAELGAEDRVVVSPIQVVIDGMKVRPVPAEEARRS